MRSQAIDLIKGIAIVAVICLHTLSPGTLDAIGAQFYLWQAVPVFLFLMGLNATSSLRRRGGRTMRELYSRDYLAGRFDRVYVPFLIAFLVTLALALLTQTPHSRAPSCWATLMTPEAAPASAGATPVRAAVVRLTNDSPMPSADQDEADQHLPVGGVRHAAG